jgi:hypothetical protein
MPQPIAQPASIFFGVLKRRAVYTVKANGSFYSYEHYRKHFRHEISEDCQQRCVYCDSHENEMGGWESMELDHFRPYTRANFRHLEDDPNNFHHSCGRCNRLKSDKWPSTNPTEPHDGRVGFIDPFRDDRRKYFWVEPDGELTPLLPPAEYLIRTLAMNRPLLKRLRLRRMLRAELNTYVTKMLPVWDAAAKGKGNLSQEALGRCILTILDYQRLMDLCDAPLTALRS